MFCPTTPRVERAQETRDGGMSASLRGPSVQTAEELLRRRLTKTHSVSLPVLCQHAFCLKEARLLATDEEKNARMFFLPEVTYKSFMFYHFNAVLCVNRSQV